MDLNKLRGHKASKKNQIAKEVIQTNIVVLRVKGQIVNITEVKFKIRMKSNNHLLVIKIVN